GRTVLEYGAIGARDLGRRGRRRRAPHADSGGDHRRRLHLRCKHHRQRDGARVRAARPVAQRRLVDVGCACARGTDHGGRNRESDWHIYSAWRRLDGVAGAGWPEPRVTRRTGRALMRVGIRLGALIAVFTALAIGVLAQSATTTTVDPGLKQRVERRFDVLPIQGGVVLKPKRTTAVRVIEIRESIIEVDGVPATGALLREKLGADADLVLQVSYL